MKTAIFGGSFNPPHMGHINVVTTVIKKLGLKKVHVVPANQNPLKTPVEGASAEQRLAMARLAFESYGEQIVIDDQEIRRGGKSYTIDTVKELLKTTKSQDLFVIVGLDAFDGIGEWKDFSNLLELTNFVVVTRPGSHMPDSIEELPAAIRPFVKEFEFNIVELKTSRNIQFVNLQDVDVSGTELRKRIRAGRNLEKFLPLAVETYIKEHKLYQPIGAKISDYAEFTKACAQVLFDKKGIAVRAFDLRDLSAPSEFALITSGTSTRHASSMAETLVQFVKNEYGVYPQSVEGVDEGRWVLVDYGALIVHIFYDYVRQEYKLENLWQKAKEINLTDKAASPQA